MDKPVLIIEAPELSDEAAAIVLDFLQALLNAFDAHVHQKARRCQQWRHRASCQDDDSEDSYPC